MTMFFHRECFIKESTMNYDELFRRWPEKEWKVCIYGLGYLGKRLYQVIPEILGIKVDMCSDSDRKKVDQEVIPGVKGIYIEELLKSEEDVVVLVMADDPYDDEIEKTLSINKHLHTVTLRQLTHLPIVIEKFYGERLYRKYLELPAVNM